MCRTLTIFYRIKQFCRPTYGKVIMQEMIEFVNSNSVISEQQYKHRLEYKGKRLFLQLKITCHNACILKINNRQQFKLCSTSMRSYFLSSIVCCHCIEINRKSVNQNKGPRTTLAMIQRFGLFLLKTVANKIL